MLLTGAALALALGTGAATRAVALPSALHRAEGRVAASFASRGLAYPPEAVALIALKREGRLELWARQADRWTFVRSYLIRAASGRLGPKLREGDHQVPEGMYGITAFNPTSRYHLSLRLGYPNAFDRARAAEDGRQRLGGDIMIHGGSVSDGCLPIGDEGIEDIFALVERVGKEAVEVVVSPVDLRRVDAARALALAGRRPGWLPGLYATIATALEPFALPAADAPRPTGRGRGRGAGCRPWDEAQCLARCAAGDATSCARAGLVYAHGRAGAADAVRARSLLATACVGGDMLGCAELAERYVADDGPERDVGRAADLAEAACAEGNGQGCATLARLCTERLLYTATPERCSTARVRRLRATAVARLRRDCEGWNAHDCATLAAVYYPGDLARALEFARGACAGGHAGGCDVLARLGGAPPPARIGLAR